MKLTFEVPNDTEVVFFNFTYGDGLRYGMIVTDDGEDKLYDGAVFTWDEDSVELELEKRKLDWGDVF